MSDIQTKYRGRVVTVNIETVLLPTGVRAEYEIIHHPGGAAIVAVDDEKRVCLLHQFRPAGGGWIWELPAGRLEPGEPPDATAKRELLEEAGCVAGQWQELGIILSSPGVFAERIHLYLAQKLRLEALQHENYEVIEVHWVPLQDAVERALGGDIQDAKTIVGLLRARAKIVQVPQRL
jgi:8-oxo-dGTP pyrophosphatase MutT (NUDIX family)